VKNGLIGSLSFLFIASAIACSGWASRGARRAKRPKAVSAHRGQHRPGHRVRRPGAHRSAFGTRVSPSNRGVVAVPREIAELAVLAARHHGDQPASSEGAGLRLVPVHLVLTGTYRGKLGIDVVQVKGRLDPETRVLELELPRSKLLSVELLDLARTFEDESWFTPISTEEVVELPSRTAGRGMLNWIKPNCSGAPTGGSRSGCSPPWVARASRCDLSSRRGSLLTRKGTCHRVGAFSYLLRDLRGARGVWVHRGPRLGDKFCKAPLMMRCHVVSRRRTDRLSCSERLATPFAVFMVVGWMAGVPSVLGGPRIDGGIEIPEVAPVGRFEFVEEERKILEGLSGADSSDQLDGIREDDSLGILSVAARFYQNGTYTGGDFNHNGFPVVRGRVRRSTGEEGWPAYRVHPPVQRARKFLASRHMVCIRFEEREDHVIQVLEDGTLKKLLEVERRRIERRDFTPLPEIEVSSLRRPVTLVVAPAEAFPAMRRFGPVAEGVEGGVLLEDAEFRLTQLNFAVAGDVYDTATGFPHGPDSHANIYGRARRFFPVLHPERGLGVVWQDRRDFRVQVSWLGRNLREHRQHRLMNIGRQELVAATIDDEGRVYYFTVQAGKSVGNVPRKASLFKASPDGKMLMQSDPDTSKRGLNIKGYDRNSGSMAVSNGRLGLVFSRTMFNGHQGAIGLVFDCDDLRLIKHHGQTSGHSFDSCLQADSAGNFLGMDLGDNYPRGLHLHRFNDNHRRSKVVFTFKTEHARRPTGRGLGSQRYRGISGPGMSFYRWSNDNCTYTELGGIAECEYGIAVVFAGEPAPDGRAIDNHRSLGRHFDPRNIGMVVVRSDFEKVRGQNGKLVPPGLVRSAGISERGGFYDFGGKWKAQNNEGVIWLTDYTDKGTQNASRVKLATLPDESLLILWEVWTPREFVTTRMMRVDGTGRKLSDEIDLGRSVRLGRREDPVVDGWKVILVSGNGPECKLQVQVVEWRDGERRVASVEP
jgi:hypothetical protein